MVDATQAQRSEENDLKLSLAKIATNVNASSKSLFDHQTHVNQLSDMIEDQADGPAKQELMKVLKNANEHVKDLEQHVNVGKNLIQ